MFVEVLPKCDFCGEDAYCDCKSVMGGWANMCKKHYQEFGVKNMKITEFELRTPAKPKKNHVVKGIEDRSLERLQAVMFGSEDREIICPECNDARKVEPDAEYTYDCEGCGTRVRCPVPVC